MLSSREIRHLRSSQSKEKKRNSQQHTDETTMYYYDTNSKSRRMAPSPTSTGINSTSAVDDHNQKGEASSTSGNVDTLISFFVTGFGPFGGNPENPTSTIIEALQQEQTAENPRLSNVHLLNIIRVSASSAAEEVNRIIDQVKPHYNNINSSQQQESTGKGCNNYKHAVIIHFGVNHMKGQKKVFQLEQNAFNEANFRIPDEDGFQPKNEQICESRPLRHKLSTDLSASRIKDNLTKKGFDVGLSGDAGRFVCNYIYWSSLQKVQEEAVKNNDNSTSEDGDVDIHVMFVHVPKFEDISKETQIEFSMELLDSIKEAIIAKDKKKRKKG